jgi:hypothetical protein
VQWVEYLLGFGFTVKYIPVDSNGVVDALSHRYKNDGPEDVHDPHEFVDADAQLDPEVEDTPGRLATGVEQLMVLGHSVPCGGSKQATPIEKTVECAEHAESHQEWADTHMLDSRSEARSAELSAEGKRRRARESGSDGGAKDGARECRREGEKTGVEYGKESTGRRIRRVYIVCTKRPCSRA